MESSIFCSNSRRLRRSLVSASCLTAFYFTASYCKCKWTNPSLLDLNQGLKIIIVIFDKPYRLTIGEITIIIITDLVLFSLSQDWIWVRCSITTITFILPSQPLFLLDPHYRTQVIQVIQVIQTLYKL